MSVSIRERLQRLQELLTEPALPECPATLAELGEPDTLASLFGITLRTLLRAPHRDAQTPPPSRVLEVAQHAAEAGTLPLSTPVALRALLEELAGRLRSAGAWAVDHPLWWQPLPAEIEAELRWTSLARSDRWPTAAELRAQLTARSWATLQALLEPETCRVLHQQLEVAFEAGCLTLERAGVGADERVSTRRSDAVRYLNGHEPELLRAAPDAAAWIQCCLSELGQRLADVAAHGQSVFPPASAMLARYPAPSEGFHPHLDNPGGDDDNGRTLTLVVYLNGSEAACDGGEIALWDRGQATSEPPAVVVPARGGTAILFDSRTLPHQVRPLKEGPARWALTLWFNDAPQRPPEPPPLPSLTLTDLLLPIPEPPLPPETVLLHELDDVSPAGTITVRRAPLASPRVGLLSTVYRAGRALEAWVRHHLELGFVHLLLIFDHLEEPAESEVAQRLASLHGDRLTVWSGAAVADERWPALEADVRSGLEAVARSGSSNPAIAARQALGASAALEAARDIELGGAPLDWLLHLDADELFVLDGPGRGGATLDEHFAAADHAGLSCLRYVNHELLHGEPRHSEHTHSEARSSFKLNPRLAAARLGAVGWSKLAKHLGMAQTDVRPYFTGYFNGKSAVRVSAAAGAAGVHGWSLKAPDNHVSRFLAGPSVLHFHLTSRSAFRAKYLAVADAQAPPGPALFAPSPLEETVLETLREQRRAGADTATLERELDRLHARMTTFTDNEIALLEAAGLLLSPPLEHPLDLESATDPAEPAPEKP